MTTAASQRAFGRELLDCVTHVFGDLHYKLDAPLQACGFDAEGRLYTLEEGGELRRFDPASGAQASSYPVGETEAAWAFSRDCKYLVGVGDALVVWDLHGDPGPVGTAPVESAVAVAVAPSGKVAAVGLANGEVHVHALPSGKRLARLASGAGAPSALAFSGDDVFLASAHEDRTLAVWGWEEEVLLKTLIGHTDRIEAVAWSPNDDRLATGNWDTSVRIWNAKTGELEAMLNGHAERVLCVGFLPEAFGADALASGDSEGFVRIWNWRTLAMTSAHRLGRGTVSCLAVGERCVVAAPDRSWRRIDADAEPLSPTESPQSAVVALATAKETLLVLHENDDASMFRGAKREPVAALAGSRVAAVAALPQGGWAFGLAEGRVALADADGKRLIREFKSDDAPVSQLVVTPSGSHLATAHRDDSTLRIWNLATGELEIVVPEATLGGSLESADIHPKDGLLAFAGVDWNENRESGRRLKVSDWDNWSPPAGARLVRPRVPFQPRGAVVLWDADLWAVRQVLDGGARRVRFHPQGNTLATVSMDGAVLIWDHVVGEILHDLGPVGGGAVDLAFDGSGRFLAVASHDGVASLFEAKTGALVGTAELEMRLTSLAFLDSDRFVVGATNGACLAIDVNELGET